MVDAKAFLIDEFDKSKFNIIYGGILALVAHPLYYSIYTFWLVQPYDSAFFRLGSALISIPLLFTSRCPEKLKPMVMVYWYFWVVFILPLTFTYNMLMNNVSTLWVIGEMMMIFLVMLFVSNIAISLIILLVGIIVAYLCFIIFGANNISISAKSATEYLMLVPISIICAIVLVLGIKKGEVEKKRMMFKALSGSIAHELRNPLGAIDLISDQIQEAIKNNSEVASKANLIALTSQISESISGANSIINLMLSDLNEKPIDESDFSYTRPSLLLVDSVVKYGYRGQSEKDKVSINFDGNFELKTFANDFVFKVVPERFTFIVYNLLKNALYYLGQNSQMRITVGTESRILGKKNWNVVYVHDTGPGIPAKVIPKLFDDFYTLGKKEGTGLGLAFCKRNMKAFGGDIICESELGKWTKFSLLFPVVDAEVVGNEFITKSAKLQKDLLMQKQEDLSQDFISAIKSKKILIADDQELNLSIFAKKLENLGMEVTKAKNGKELVEAYKNSFVDFDIIFTDINMPILSGTDAAKKIREIESKNSKNNATHGKRIPIIAITGDSEAIETTSFLESGMTDYFVKGDDVSKLIKIIAMCLKAESKL